MGVIYTFEPKSTNKAMQCAMKILDVKYKKTDIPHAKIPNIGQQNSLNIINSNNCLMVCYWILQWFFDLKEDANPYHDNPYPVLREHVETFKKEQDGLELIGVIPKTRHGSKWGFPS